MTHTTEIDGLTARELKNLRWRFWLPVLFWGLPPWFIGDHLFPVSSFCLCPCPNLLFLKGHQSHWVSIHPADYVYFNYLYKDFVSKDSHVLRNWARTSTYEFGGHNSAYNALFREHIFFPNKEIGCLTSWARLWTENQGEKSAAGQGAGAVSAGHVSQMLMACDSRRDLPKCRSWSSKSGEGLVILHFLTSPSWMLLLLVHGPHFE